MSTNRRRLLLSKSNLPVVTYQYIINSNCIGGKVLFDNVEVGSIPSNGVFIATISNGNPSYSVTISGGLPSSTSSYENHLVATPELFNFPLAGGSIFCIVTSTSVFKTVTYYSPTPSVIFRGSTIIMNANPNNEYGEPFDIPYTAYGIPDWIGMTKATNGYVVGCVPSSIPRSDTARIDQDGAALGFSLLHFNQIA